MIIASTSIAIDSNGDVVQGREKGRYEFIRASYYGSTKQSLKNFILFNPRRKIVVFDGQLKVKQAFQIKKGDWLVFNKNVPISVKTKNLLLSVVPKVSFIFRKNQNKVRYLIRFVNNKIDIGQRLLFKALMGYCGVWNYVESFSKNANGKNICYRCDVGAFGSLTLARTLSESPRFFLQYEKPIDYALQYANHKTMPRIPSSFQLRLICRDIYILMVREKVGNKEKEIFYDMYVKKGAKNTFPSGRVLMSVYIPDRLKSNQLIIDTCKILDYLYDNYTFVKVGSITKQRAYAVEVDDSAYVDWMEVNPQAKYINYEKHVKQIIFKKKNALERFKEQRAGTYGINHPTPIREDSL